MSSCVETLAYGCINDMLPYFTFLYCNLLSPLILNLGYLVPSPPFFSSLITGIFIEPSPPPPNSKQANDVFNIRTFITRRSRRMKNMEYML